eukprot:s4302_g8.t1
MAAEAVIRCEVRYHRGIEQQDTVPEDDDPYDTLLLRMSITLAQSGEDAADELQLHGRWAAMFQTAGPGDMLQLEGVEDRDCSLCLPFAMSRYASCSYDARVCCPFEFGFVMSTGERFGLSAAEELSDDQRNGRCFSVSGDAAAVTIYRDGFHYRVDKKTMEKLDLPEWLRIPPSRKADFGWFQGSVTADPSAQSRPLFPAMKCGRSSCQLVILPSRQAQFGQCMVSGPSELWRHKRLRNAQILWWFAAIGITFLGIESSH